MRIAVALVISTGLVAPGALAEETPAGSSAAECAVVQSAFTSMLARDDKAGLVFPKDIQASRPWAPLDRDIKPYTEDFDLTESEQADLLAQWTRHADTPWTPVCAWQGKPAVIRDGELTMTSDFTRPLFSSDGRLALLSWSVRSTGRWGYGRTCLARLTAAGWKTACRPSWIA